jgi:hypothetical protein
VGIVFGVGQQVKGHLNLIAQLPPVAAAWPIGWVVGQM